MLYGKFDIVMFLLSSLSRCVLELFVLRTAGKFKRAYAVYIGGGVGDERRNTIVLITLTDGVIGISDLRLSLIELYRITR